MMAALYMAMGLIWKPLECPESWRWSRKQIQIIWGGGGGGGAEGKKMGMGFRGGGKVC